MSSKALRRTRAFNAVDMRQQMLQNLVVPSDLLQKAVKKLEQHIDAKKRVYFTKDGVVLESRIVDDNETQQRAIDKILRMADLYGHEHDSSAKKQNNTVGMRLDTKTGVLYVVIGANDDQENVPSLDVLEQDASSSEIVETPALPPGALAEASESIGEGELEAPYEKVVVENIKGLPKDVYNKLYGKDA